MSKAKLWKEEVLSKHRTKENLRFTQIKAIHSCLLNLHSECTGLISGKNEDFEVELKFSKAGTGLVSKVVKARDLLQPHIDTLGSILEQNSTKKNKLKFNNPSMCLEIHQAMAYAIELLDSHGVVSKDRLNFLNELNNVFTSHDFYLVFDLEMTCDPDREHMRSETLEIGLVVVDSKSLNVIDQFESMVKPKLNPVLTDFIMNLTGITQGEVNAADEFSEVARQLESFLKPYGNSIAFQWGEGDMRQIRLDSELHSVPNPFGSIVSYDVKNAYSRMYHKKNSTGLRRAAEMMAVQREGCAHRALSDAILTWDVFKNVRNEWEKEFKIVTSNSDEHSDLATYWNDFFNVLHYSKAEIEAEIEKTEKQINDEFRCLEDEYDALPVEVDNEFWNEVNNLKFKENDFICKKLIYKSKVLAYLKLKSLNRNQ